MHTLRYNSDIHFQCLEDIKETSMEITLVHMGKEQCKSNHAVSASRDEYIIHFIIAGKGFYSAGGKTWSIEAGQMFLIYPGERIFYCSDENNPWSYLWIGFKGLRVDTLLKKCGFSKSNLVLPAPAPDEYMGCFDNLFKHRALNFSDDLYRESALLKLFAILINLHNQFVFEDHPEETKYSDNIYVNVAIDYIGQMYMQGIGVSEIAEAIGISRAHLNHVFQKELNISIQKFLIDFRMHKAANLLVSTTMSIREISDQIGYNDQLVFSRAFKNKFGMSPRNYRTSVDEIEIKTGNNLL